VAVCTAAYPPSDGPCNGGNAGELADMVKVLEDWEAGQE
jgi:hypothetical protein